MEETSHHAAELWVAVGFAIVVALLLWKRVPGLIAKVLDQRAAAITAELNEARQLRAEAAALLAEYQAKAAGADAEATAILKDAQAEAARFAAESRAALTAQIARREAAAKDKIAQAEAAALNEIRGLAADAAVNAAQKLIAARMDAGRASGLIADSIKTVGDKLN